MVCSTPSLSLAGGATHCNANPDQNALARARRPHGGGRGEGGLCSRAECVCGGRRGFFFFLFYNDSKSNVFVMLLPGRLEPADLRFYKNTGVTSKETLNFISVPNVGVKNFFFLLTF